MPYIKIAGITCRPAKRPPANWFVSMPGYMAGKKFHRYVEFPATNLALKDLIEKMVENYVDNVTGDEISTNGAEEL